MDEMMRRWMFLLGCALALVSASASAAAGRTIVSLSGAGWTCDGEAVSIPHTWNAVDGADGSPTNAIPEDYVASIGAKSYLHKKAVYRRALPDPTSGRRQFIRFGAVSSKATVLINGQLAGTHAGAFTAFTIEATALLKPSGNVLEVIADNRWDADLAPLSADYTLMGGIYRDVEWIETPPVCIDPVTDGTDGIVLDINTNGTVIATVRISTTPQSPTTNLLPITYSLLPTPITYTYTFPTPKLWSPESPNLYTAKVEIASGDAVEVPFGFRTAEFRKDGFYLNGVKRKLKGVNRHQDAGLCGWAATAVADERDFALIKEVGADAVRLAHYPQSRRVLDLCDRLGFLVWSEVPAINWLSKTDAFRQNLLQQAREMVAQNRNHPSVFAWSVYNEIYNCAPPELQDEGWMEAILSDVRDELKRLDPTRPVVAASCMEHKILLNSLPEELAFNVYPRWYVDWTMMELIDRWFSFTQRENLGISEYGAGGDIALHVDELPRTRIEPAQDPHPEELQTKLHIDDYRAIVSEDRIWGSFIWAMFDFAADARREGHSHGVNDKGLVTRDRRTKKDVFYFYQANWTESPVLHLCSSRQTATTNDHTTVVAFCNHGPVTLFVNDTFIGTQTPSKVKVVSWNDVALKPGDNKIEVRSASRTATRHLLCPSVTSQSASHE